MAVSIRALLPRVLVVAAVWIIASGTLTFAADKTLTSKAAPKTPAALPKPTVVVPDVRTQAFVFAKGILEDGGFAWRVTGPVHGYATNVVASQTPAAGARLVDTGAPTIALRLTSGKYAQGGNPEDTSPYVGTAAILAKALNAPTKKPAARKFPLAPPKVKKAAPARKGAKPARKKAVRLHARLRRRHAAFLAPGAPKEPLDEISLPARATRLSVWLTPSRRPTAANQRHWLYQHAWIVTGARFGWWHGAAALRVLISVDRRVESQWGIGTRSETVARAALAAVEARAK
jgi:hypothetical protein